MRLTVLGKSPAWTDRGGACSGYLVEEGATAFLLDCGNGVFGKLRERRDYREVEGAVISHLHADHLLDLVPFAYALTVGPDRALRRRLAVHAPLGARDFLRRLISCWDEPELVDRAFDVHEYRPVDEFEIGAVTVRTHPVRHFGPTHAIELISPAGGRIVFGADGRASEELVGAARGAAVLIAEATLPEPDTGPLEDRGHMSAEEAGEVAREAGVGRLVLTHVSDELDLDRAQARAAASFGGPVEVAAEGAVFVTD